VDNNFVSTAAYFSRTALDATATESHGPTTQVSRSLQLVDAAGGVHALLPGATVALPRQRVAIIAAA
jgi:hypothetical protein